MCHLVFPNINILSQPPGIGMLHSDAFFFRSSNGDLGQELFELEFALFSKQAVSE